MESMTKFLTCSESQIEFEILKHLASLKIGFFWKNVSGGFFDGTRFRKQANPFAIRGTPDIIGIVNGRFIGIEVKAANGKLSQHQKAFIEKAQSLGALCGVAHSPLEAHKLLEAWQLI